MKSFFCKILTIGRSIAELRISVYAGNATFFILLSLFPGIMALLSAVHYLPATIKDVQDFLTTITPAPIHDFMDALFAGLRTVNTAAILSVTAVGAILSVTRAMVGIMNGLDVVYRCPKSRPLLQKWSIGFLGAVLLFISILAILLLQVFGDTLYSFALSHDRSYANFIVSLLHMRWLFSFGFLTLVFCLFYTILPQKQHRPTENLPGALVSTFGWLIYSALFGFYVDNFSNYANLYGSLTAIVVTMLWLYFCLNLIFYGGLLNYILIEVPHPLQQLRRYFRNGRS